MFFSDVGDFIGFISNWDSKSFLDDCVSSYRAVQNHFPIHSFSVPECLGPGIGRSDHKSFWLEGFPA